MIAKSPGSSGNHERLALLPCTPDVKLLFLTTFFCLVSLLHIVHTEPLSSIEVLIVIKMSTLKHFRVSFILHSVCVCVCAHVHLYMSTYKQITCRKRNLRQMKWNLWTLRTSIMELDIVNQVSSFHFCPVGIF